VIELIQSELNTLLKGNTMQFQVIRETTTTHTTIVEADSLESANDFARINNDELSWDLSSSDSYFSSFDVE